MFDGYVARLVKANLSDPDCNGRSTITLENGIELYAYFMQAYVTTWGGVRWSENPFPGAMAANVYKVISQWHDPEYMRAMQEIFNG